ncbi:hypothetical protein C1752_06389 [Acaryochloris thomasi RCC1774]|uniref:Glyoxalase-like domain protein n=2 Tax=Acaryochloris TaxID=155977 RepID=A0A2W1JMU7_9CYAN|nr:hypothetical protein C1752_06389 [Acaryochloris thomasi RCC1774]
MVSLFNLSTSLPSMGVFGPLLALDGLLSTQGVMVMLLVAYAGAMWMFLSSAPKVHTLMVSDLEVARQFFENELQLRTADVPLHYYYNYEQTLGLSAVDPIYMSAVDLGTPASKSFSGNEGLWFQLKKNVQLHVITGASIGEKDRQRHVCFDHDCLEKILVRVQTRYVKYKLRSEMPLNFLVKTLDGSVIEFSEVSA